MKNITEWDGDGLPPVGCECEVKDSGNTYDKCRILYSGEEGVAFTYVGPRGQFISIDCVSKHASADYFRPTRSEADKKRDAAISAIDAACLLVRDASKTAEAIYYAIAAGDIPGVKLE